MRKISKYYYLKPACIRYISFCEGLGLRKASGQLSSRIHIPKHQSKIILKNLVDAGIFEIKNKRLSLTKKGRKLLRCWDD